MRWNSRNRTLLGAALAIPCLAMLLVMFACLPAPVGNPETAKVDPALVGAWKGKDGDKKLLVLIRPWDTHTYFVQYCSTPPDPAGGDKGMLHIKAWLTTLGKKTFLVCEPFDEFAYIPDSPIGSKPFWIVGLVEVDATTLKFRRINEDSPLVKGLTTREQIEAAITANVDKDALYVNDPLTLTKVGKEEATLIDDTLKAFSIGK